MDIGTRAAHYTLRAELPTALTKYARVSQEIYPQAHGAFIPPNNTLAAHYRAPGRVCMCVCVYVSAARHVACCCCLRGACVAWCLREGGRDCRSIRTRYGLAVWHRVDVWIKIGSCTLTICGCRAARQWGYIPVVCGACWEFEAALKQDGDGMRGYTRLDRFLWGYCFESSVGGWFSANLILTQGACPAFVMVDMPTHTRQRYVHVCVALCAPACCCP